MLHSLRTADRLELTQPQDPDGQWVASVGLETPLRLSAPLARVLKWFDEDRPGSVQEYVGVKMDPTDLGAAVDMLQQAGLLVDHDAHHSPAPRQSRVKVNSLFSIQFAVLNRPGQFAWLTALARRGILIAGAYLALVSAAAGIIILVTNASAVVEAATSPMPVINVLVMILALVVSVSIHEFAHALMLIYYGGRVRRMGVMLFYLSPAFFCDVTDAWRLPRKEQRTRVALAGVVATFAIAGMFAVVSALLGFEHPWLTVAAVALFAGSVANLVPFIKLDGYIALMTYLDEPNLRRRTMLEWKEALVGLTLGGAHTPGVKLMRIAFGVLSSLTPVMILFVLARSLTGASAGFVGRGIAALLLWGVVIILGHGLYRIVKTHPGGPSPLRRASIAAGACAALALPLMITVQTPFSGVYWVDDGRVLIAPLPQEQAGESITLKRDGIITSVEVGAGQVTDTVLDSQVPIQVLAPNLSVEGEMGPEPGQVVDVLEGEIPAQPGSFELTSHTQTLGAWVWATLLMREPTLSDVPPAHETSEPTHYEGR